MTDEAGNASLLDDAIAVQKIMEEAGDVIGNDDVAKEDPAPIVEEAPAAPDPPAVDEPAPPAAEPEPEPIHDTPLPTDQPEHRATRGQRTRGTHQRDHKRR